MPTKISPPNTGAKPRLDGNAIGRSMKSAKCASLSPAAERTLKFITQNPGASRAQIIDRMDMVGAPLDSVVAELKEKGFVRENQSGLDVSRFFLIQ